MSDVYLKAAKLVYKNKYACVALLDASFIAHKEKSHFIYLYESYFSPLPKTSKKHSTCVWFGDIDKKENQLARELSLLFMHEIIKND